jgi:uncharacterized membrane protein
MNTLFPIFAAILQATGATLDKVILSIKRVSFRTYMGVAFPFYFLSVSVLYFIFRPGISYELFSGLLGFLLVLSIIEIITANIFYYRALDSDNLGEVEMIYLVSAVPIIIFSSIFFVDERNMVVVALALVASCALLWGHWERKHIRIHKKTLYLFLWIMIGAPLNAILTKELLQIWHPLSLELIRGGALALVFFLLFRKYAERIPVRALPLLIITNIFFAGSNVLFYMGYQQLGIVYTVLLFSLEPLLVYTASLLYLKEKAHPRKIIAFGIVLISVTIAQFLRR